MSCTLSEIIVGILQDPSSKVIYLRDQESTAHTRFRHALDSRCGKYNVLSIYVDGSMITHLSFSLCTDSGLVYVISKDELDNDSICQHPNPYENLSDNCKVQYNLLHNALLTGNIEFLDVSSRSFKSSGEVLSELRDSGIPDTLYITEVNGTITPMIECDLGYVMLYGGVYSLYL